MTHAQTRATEGTPMRRTPWRAMSLVLLLGLALWACDGPNRGTNTQPSAASGENIIVTASPNTLKADGKSQAIVQVKVFDTHGNLIDGATVSLAATNGTVTTTAPTVGVVTGTGGGGAGTPATSPTAGTGANTTATAGVTTRGLLTATFTAGTTPGTAIVTATVEDAVSTTLITLF